MKDFDQLNIDDLDLIKEVNNICAGHAADALSQMLGKQVRISIPATRIVDFSDAVFEIGDAEKVVGGILIQLSGEIDGVALFVYDLDFANGILGPLMGVNLEDYSQIDEDCRSALSEIANILVGSYGSAMSKLTHCRVDLSVPSATINMLGGIISVPMAMFGYETNKLMYNKTEFIIDGQNLTNWLMLIPNMASMNKIIEQLGV